MVRKYLLQFLLWLLWLLVQSTLQDHSQLLQEARYVKQIVEKHVISEPSEQEIASGRARKYGQCGDR